MFVMLQQRTNLDAKIFNFKMRKFMETSADMEIDLHQQEVQETDIKSNNNIIVDDIKIEIVQENSPFYNEQILSLKEIVKITTVERDAMEKVCLRHKENLIIEKKKTEKYKIINEKLQFQLLQCEESCKVLKKELSLLKSLKVDENASNFANTRIESQNEILMSKESIRHGSNQLEKTPPMKPIYAHDELNYSPSLVNVGIKGRSNAENKIAPRNLYTLNHFSSTPKSTATISGNVTKKSNAEIKNQHNYKPIEDSSAPLNSNVLESLQDNNESVTVSPKNSPILFKSQNPRKRIIFDSDDENSFDLPLKKPQHIGFSETEFLTLAAGNSSSKKLFTHKMPQSNEKAKSNHDFEDNKSNNTGASSLPSIDSRFKNFGHKNTIIDEDGYKIKVFKITDQLKIPLEN
ncbi:uncharacterized protein LOC131674428 isoform X1 [Phymastichus coffea]|uniref:uncharacterized protein LOC131674428 isoform X1 n=2 Tax=Phymastichus coffea TaxID=108790 RepID=UPI00273CD9D8|nr:uncharacterized protein LOC131674428 isoform X1 [Phymastichus coffea]XP_058809107.1 uncharacterized protein LOC131674428 isoform X1 [Phymastichus coffea]XP_058809111.1 uncharacterized protein LOC131674428 isoform X1 [Phymastichus coffea]